MHSNYVFVYGSLKNGFFNHCLIEETAEFVSEALTEKNNFEMHSLGSFPAAVLNPRSAEAGKLCGEIYKCKSPKYDQFFLSLLDELEGVEYGLYQRTLESFILLPSEKIVKAWIYTMKPQQVQSLKIYSTEEGIGKLNMNGDLWYMWTPSLDF